VTSRRDGETIICTIRQGIKRVGLTNMDVTKEMVEVGIPGVMGLVKTTSAYRESNNKLCNVRRYGLGPGVRDIVPLSCASMVLQE
jgi:hypothetical protein